MQKYLLVILLFALSCKPYKDPDPIKDPRLTNPYCNDPAAINYNWEFPGVPDNTTCIFPSDVFEGNYIWYDSTQDENLNILAFDSTFVNVAKVDTTRLTLSGKCNYNLSLTADRFLNIVIDSLHGDGQQFCQTNDTIIGTGLKIGFADTTSFTMNYIIVSDTGSSFHKAYFLKQ